MGGALKDYRDHLADMDAKGIGVSMKVGDGPTIPINATAAAKVDGTISEDGKVVLTEKGKRRMAREPSDQPLPLGDTTSRLKTNAPLGRRPSPRMATPAFLVRLMDHRALARTLRLGSEDTEAYAFANALRALTLEGRLKAVWTHPANELAAASVEGGKVRVPARVALARALGLIGGSSDYLFLWDGGSAAFEFKSKDGSLSPSQRDWRDWCLANGVHFFVVRSVKQGLDLLESLGLLDR